MFCNNVEAEIEGLKLDILAMSTIKKCIVSGFNYDKDTNFAMPAIEAQTEYQYTVGTIDELENVLSCILGKNGYVSLCEQDTTIIENNKLEVPNNYDCDEAAGLFIILENNIIKQYIKHKLHKNYCDVDKLIKEIYDCSFCDSSITNIQYAFNENNKYLIIVIPEKNLCLYEIYNILDSFIDILNLIKEKLKEANLDVQYT